MKYVLRLPDKPAEIVPSLKALWRRLAEEEKANNGKLPKFSADAK